MYKVVIVRNFCCQRTTSNELLGARQREIGGLEACPCCGGGDTQDLKHEHALRTFVASILTLGALYRVLSFIPKTLSYI